MAETIEMIQLSPTMEEGLLVAWLKKEGDTVSVGDLIAEVETDKASMEMESFYDGTILKILVSDGASVRVGTPLAIIGEPGEDISALLGTAAPSASADAPAAATPPASTKAAAETPAATHADEASTPAADESRTDDAQAASRSESNAGESTTDESPDSASSATPRVERASGDDERVLSSPVARRIASEHAIAVEAIAGSGPAGRVIKRDVEAAIASAKQRPAPAVQTPAIQTPATAPRSAPSTDAGTQVRVEPLSPMRRAIAKNTTAAWEVPAFMLTRSICMDAALALRKDANASLERAGETTKISVNDLIIKAAALALRAVPAVNAAFEGDAIRRYERSRIGVAVAIDGGLLTPIVANAEGKSLGSIAREVRDLADRAKSKKLASDEYSDASFTISNLGMFGIEHFTAVLNPPGAAILAVGATRAVLVPADNERGFAQEQQMRVTLTCDHRALDGAVGAQWLQHFAAYLEEPFTLLL